MNRGDMFANQLKRLCVFLQTNRFTTSRLGDFLERDVIPSEHALYPNLHYERVRICPTTVERGVFHKRLKPEVINNSSREYSRLLLYL